MLLVVPLSVISDENQVESGEQRLSRKQASGENDAQEIVNHSPIERANKPAQRRKKRTTDTMRCGKYRKQPASHGTNTEVPPSTEIQTSQYKISVSETGTTKSIARKERKREKKRENPTMRTDILAQ